jgi:hypothetical protein
MKNQPDLKINLFLSNLSMISTPGSLITGYFGQQWVELFLSFWTPWKCSDEEAGMDGGNRKAFGLLGRSEPGSDPMPFTYLVLKFSPCRHSGGSQNSDIWAFLDPDFRWGDDVDYGILLQLRRDLFSAEMLLSPAGRLYGRSGAGHG